MPEQPIRVTEEEGRKEITEKEDMTETDLKEITDEGGMTGGDGKEVAEEGHMKETDKEITEEGNREETTEEERCGMGTCQPPFLQRFSNLICFTLFLSFSGFCSLLQGPLLVSQVTSIERQFELNSTQLGALMSANDIGFLLMVLVVSHFAKDAHIPRILSVASFVFGIASILIAAMNFVQPRSLQEADMSVNNSEAGVAAQDKYLCVPDLLNATFQGGCDAGDTGRSVSNLPLVIAIGCFLGMQGITKATRTPLGVTYIDNNVPQRSKTGLYVGINLSLILFGPPVGLAMGGFISRIPVDLSATSLTSSDPRWIGAWWIGFLLIGALAMLGALPMLCFPRRMSSPNGGTDGGTQETAKSRDEEADDKATTKYGVRDEAKPTCGEVDTNGHTQQMSTDEKETVVDDLERKSESNKQDGKFLWMLKELPLSLLRLIRNPVYVVLVVAFGLQLFAVVGFSSFLIKFVERQFDLPSWLSSYVFGLGNLIFSGLGTFVGGVLVSRCNLTRRGCLRCVVLGLSASTLLTAITLGLGCNPDPMVGLHSGDFVLDDGVSTCSCDVTQFLPVCDENRTFRSPCHAGCSRAANSTHFLDCGLAGKGDVTVGVCSPGCYLLIPFVVVQVLSTFFGTTSVTPIYVTILRSVSEKDKTLGMGMVSFAMSLFGFIPGPIVFGAVIDTACLIWSGTCGKTGACALYDVTKLRHRYIGVEVGVKALALALFTLALCVLTWQVRTGRTMDEKMTDAQNGSESEEEGGKKRRRGGPRIFEMMRT